MLIFLLYKQVSCNFLYRYETLRMKSYLVGISTYGLLVYCELELKIHNCHSVNTSSIIIIEEVLKLLFVLQRGGKATQRGAPLLIPIEWLINVGGSADPFQQLNCGSFLTPASGSKLLSPGLRRSCLHGIQTPARQLTCQSKVVVSKHITKSTDNPHTGGSGSLRSVPLSLLRGLCSPVEFGVAIWRFLPVSKIASGTFPVDFPGSAC